MKTHDTFASGNFWVDAAQRWHAPADAWLALGLRSAGGVWVTRDGELDDHVLQPGDKLAVRRGDWLTIEPWRAGARLRLDLQPSATAGRSRLPLGPLPASAATALRWAARSAANVSTTLTEWAPRAEGHAA